LWAFGDGGIGNAIGRQHSPSFLNQDIIDHMALGR
jgi:hypothetical protein